MVVKCSTTTTPPSQRHPLSQHLGTEPWIQQVSRNHTGRKSRSWRVSKERSSLPFMSRSCPTNGHPPPVSPVSVPTSLTRTCTNSENCFVQTPAQPLFSLLPTPPPPSQWRPSIPRVSHLPSPSPLEPAQTPSPPPSLSPSLPTPCAALHIWFQLWLVRSGVGLGVAHKTE